MKKFTEASPSELKTMLRELQGRYDAFCAQNLKLNMARGKPAPSQLDLSAPLMDKMNTYT